MFFIQLRIVRFSNIDIENDNNYDILEIEEFIIDDIAKRLAFIFNPINLLEIFIHLKVKDY
jgi:hypothetical protein